MRSFRRRAQRVLGAASKAVPNRVAYLLRSRAHQGRGSDSVNGTLMRLLETGDFHLREPFVTLDDRQLTFVGNDSVVTRTVYWYGIDAYEGGQVGLWEGLCRQAEQIREVGANVGLYSVAGGLANPVASYHAYEPHPRVFEVLRRNIAINQVTNVQLTEKAVVPAGSGDAPKVQLQMFDQDVDWHELPTGASVADVVGVSRGVRMNCISVAGVSAQDVFKGADLIKLDVEGAEGPLLRCAEEEILASRPVILLECLPEAIGLSDQLLRFRLAGFSLISPITGEKQDALTGGSSRLSTSAFATRDNLLVPNERLKLVRGLITAFADKELR